MPPPRFDPAEHEQRRRARRDAAALARGYGLSERAQRHLELLLAMQPVESTSDEPEELAAGDELVSAGLLVPIAALSAPGFCDELVGADVPHLRRLARAARAVPG